MANYQVTGRNNEGSPLVSVSIGAIDQEQHVVDEMTVVNAVRNCLLAVPGVQSVLAQKYQQVITNV
ncbi:MULTISPECIES: hypothetical protein [Streptomyces]|uniref:Uncharacterized protein n=2 Tax=Streptomyces TaxID=1883 RepID=A0ABS9JHK8_9ACTN|nr:MULTISPECIES: hypothetical protein [Streptomyces]MCG0065044.1 hypothetical protein [Streptomyces tricolor]OYP14085.1 hypothetical protein CFC35_05835 [Streptomyces sp. FBKL.4005]BCM70849.1 hypothetical protein EASAB2608_06183 [Streptomyces sp. EAS-AB2608]